MDGLRAASAWFYFGGSKQYVLDDVIARGTEAIAINYAAKTIRLRLVGNAAALCVPIYKRQNFTLRQGHYETLSLQLTGATGQVPDCDRPERLMFSLFDDRAAKMQEDDRRRFELQVEAARDRVQELRQQIRDLPSMVDPKGLIQQADELEATTLQQLKDGITPPSLYLANGERVAIAQAISGKRQAVVETGGKVTVSSDLAGEKLWFVQWPIGAKDKAMYIDLGTPLTDPISVQVLFTRPGRYQIRELRQCVLQGKYSDNLPEYNLEFTWQSEKILKEGVRDGE